MRILTKLKFFFYLLILNPTCLFAAQPNCLQETTIELSTGSPAKQILVGKTVAFQQNVGKGELHQFVDLPLSKNYDVSVYLPPGYQSSGKKYPVVYMNDGQNLFFGRNSWRVAESVDTLVGSGQEVIVVGVHFKSRSFDYSHSSHWDEHGHEIAGGGIAAYSSYLAGKLKPFIDNHYRTKSDKANTTIAGSSQGGLAAFYTGLTKRNVFGKAIVHSPSFWWGLGDVPNALRDDADSILNSKPIQTALKDSKNLPTMWMDWGTHEQLASEASQMAEVLRPIYHKAKRNERFVAVYEDGFEHTEQSWGERFRFALKHWKN